MKNKPNYTTELGADAWNFSSIWKIESGQNDGYPMFRWSVAQGQSGSEDSDGIPTEVEDNAPNNGDANNDGIPDSQQSNVASFVNAVTKSYVSIVVNEQCSLTEANSRAESANSVQDAGFDYKAGLLGFTAECGENGFTTEVQLFHYDVSKDGLRLRKFSPNTLAYFTITGAETSQQTIAGKAVTIASYEITDGGELDMNDAEDGVIVDPVGLASSAVGTPNTGLRSYSR